MPCPPPPPPLTPTPPLPIIHEGLLVKKRNTHWEFATYYHDLIKAKQRAANSEVQPVHKLTAGEQDKKKKIEGIRSQLKKKNTTPCDQSIYLFMSLLWTNKPCNMQAEHVVIGKQNIYIICNYNFCYENIFILYH